MTAVDGQGLGEVGLEAPGALSEMLARSIAAAPVATYVTADPLPWNILAQGGWDLLGAPEQDGGAGASLRDLVEVARVWGRAIVPSPLLPTLLVKRWSAAARECPGPVTVSVHTRAAGGLATAPFADTLDLQILQNAAAADGVVRTTCGPTDEYAPSLRIAEVAVSTEWPREAAREMRVLWAAEAAGCAAQMLDDAIAYAKERHQFGQPIGRFQAIKHHLANAHILAEQAETAAILASLEPERTVAASEFAFDASLRVIEIAIQIHGGLGFTWEMGLHMYLRHVGALRELAAALPA